MGVLKWMPLVKWVQLGMQYIGKAHSCIDDKHDVNYTKLSPTILTTRIKYRSTLHWLFVISKTTIALSSDPAKNVFPCFLSSNYPLICFISEINYGWKGLSPLKTMSCSVMNMGMPSSLWSTRAERSWRARTLWILFLMAGAMKVENHQHVILVHMVGCTTMNAWKCMVKRID